MELMKSKMKDTLKQPPSAVNKSSVTGGSIKEELEIRPGGMLVQKRNSESHYENSPPNPTINVKVKFGPSCFQICINSQDSFGELKKIVAERTGVHHLDQKLIYKKKERDSKSFLDVVGVKNGSKLVMIEDIISRERRCLESLKSAKFEKVSKLLQQITLQIDKLRSQVISMEESEETGESDIDNLIGILMNKLVSLDGIFAEGELKLKKQMQERRVQKYIETLDLLKIKKSKEKVRKEREIKNKIPKEQQAKQKNDVVALKKQVSIQSEPVVITTKWETFD